MLSFFKHSWIVIAVNKIKALLWHMQEDLESLRQWKLGEELIELGLSQLFCNRELLFII